ncbi:putative 26S proteasome regulatory subunit [Dimargaris xerosporica]|nr:putative 26S proteasome regulatory subunit [Dimargaris xerosporica]
MDQVQPLLARKDDIEAQLRELDQALQSHGVSFHDPLVDAEGFPRADIDVGAVRHIRVKVVTLRNDLQRVMAEIELALHALHQSTRTALTQEQQTGQ